MMNAREEKAYESGSRMAWRTILNQCLIHLGGIDLKPERLISEREDAMSALRSLCEEFGDNDWDEADHLADVIRNHLGKHMHERARTR